MTGGLPHGARALGPGFGVMTNWMYCRRHLATMGKMKEV